MTSPTPNEARRSAPSADESHDFPSVVVVPERSTTPLDSIPAHFSAMLELLDRPASVGNALDSDIENAGMLSPPRASPLPIPADRDNELVQPLSGLPPATLPNDDDETQRNSAASTSPFGSTQSSSSGYGSGGFSPPDFFDTFRHPSPDQPRPDGWRFVPRPAVPKAQACNTVGFPDPPLTILRDQFCPILKSPTPELRAWENTLKFPPRCLGRRSDPTKSKMSAIPSNKSAKPFDVDTMLQDYANGTAEFSTYLTARAPGDFELRTLVFAKEAELQRATDKLNANNRSGSSKRNKYMEKRDDIEQELLGLKDRLALRYADLNEVICQAMQGDYRACRAANCNRDFHHEVPFTSSAAWADIMREKNAATDEKRDIFIPDWFAVFDSYDIVAFSTPTPAKRFLELLNLINHLEQEISALSCHDERRQAKAGTAIQVWDKVWHDPSPIWSQKFAQKHGG